MRRRRRLPACTPRGRPCAAASCTGSTLTAARSCNGTGTCQTATTSMCNPYACNATACRTTCTVNADCVAPFTCIGGSCAKKAAGVACGVGGECLSGFCAQGVCCDSACGGTCQSCALAGTVGTCTNVAAGAGSAEPVRRPRRRELQHRRHVQRQRRLPPVRRGGAVRGGDVHRVDGHARAHVQRHRHLPDRHVLQLRALRVRHRRLPDDLHDQRRLRVAQRLQRRQLRPEAGRRRVRRRRRMQLGQLRPGVCCSGACTGTCRSCAIAGRWAPA